MLLGVAYREGKQERKNGCHRGTEGTENERNEIRIREVEINRFSYNKFKKIMWRGGAHCGINDGNKVALAGLINMV
jgi:hypothetical protein